MVDDRSSMLYSVVLVLILLQHSDEDFLFFPRGNQFPLSTFDSDSASFCHHSPAVLEWTHTEYRVQHIRIFTIFVYSAI